jgi:hypothetical protein
MDQVFPVGTLTALWISGDNAAARRVLAQGSPLLTIAISSCGIVRRGDRRVIAVFRGHFDLDDLVLDGIHDQITNRVQVEFAHNLATVCFHGLGA